MSSNSLSSEQEAAIIHACDEHERQHESLRDYRRCVVFEGFFVKFGAYGSLYPQYKTQQYISQLADGDQDAPHIPKVYHFFTRDDRRAYLVMEHIELTRTSVMDLPQRVALALRWLRGLQPPANARIGPLGGGRARHMLFKDYTAPLSFSSIEALEIYMNKALLFIRPSDRPESVDIKHELLVFTQSDMDESNFGVDKNGNTCLFDFEDVGLLPESFASYNLSYGKIPFVVEVAAHSSGLPSSNINSMSRIRAVLWMVADPTLGLDKNGVLKPKQ